MIYYIIILASPLLNIDHFDTVLAEVDIHRVACMCFLPSPFINVLVLIIWQEAAIIFFKEVCC